MDSNNKLITNNLLLDNLFINFPLWFPLVYLYLIFNFPEFGKFIFIASLFLFAETHFASTWLFFFDQDNWCWLKKNFYKIVFIPGYTLILILFIWKISPTLIIILHYLASGWHVTKQSSGILNIYGIRPKIYQFTIYAISFFCLIIGLRKPGLFATALNLDTLNIFLIFFICLYAILLILNSQRLLNIGVCRLMPFITGASIYIPILFFDNLAVATAIGVGMHWCQYLAIVWSKFFRKERIKNQEKVNIYKKSAKYIVFIFLYAFVMCQFTLSGIDMKDNIRVNYSYLYLIPIIFQLYHFYIDGFIWKFSDPQIKKSVLPFIFSNTQ